MNARDYFAEVQGLIRSVSFVHTSDLRFEQVDTSECYIRGVLLLDGSLELHIAEYVVTEPELSRPKYRYHLQQADGALLARWDNAPHHRALNGFPHHRHSNDGSVYPTQTMDLDAVLKEVIAYVIAGLGT